MENRSIDMRENWIQILKPDDFPKGGYFVVTDFRQNVDGMKIVLEDERDYVVEILFDGYPELTRISYEGERMRTWMEVQKKYQDQNFFADWFFYKVENSKLSQWIEEESYTSLLAEDFTHYCIITGDNVVDIVSSIEPAIVCKSTV